MRSGFGPMTWWYGELVPRQATFAALGRREGQAVLRAVAVTKRVTVGAKASGSSR